MVMGQTIQARQLKVLERAREADRKCESENRQRVKVGDVVKFDAGRWGASKAATAIVVRTYKAPDDDTILALPSSSEYYAMTIAAMESKTLDSLKNLLPGIYAQCRTLHVSQWRF
jgi:hypothetical protein